VFIQSDYDSDEYFCTEDGEERPLCGSVAMNEHEDDFDFNKWMDWSDKHHVSARGICDSFKVERDTCRECALGNSISGGKKCCGYLLIGGDATYIQEDGRILGDCPKGFWKRGLVPVK
jgi:hypothetical protein